MNDLFSVRNVTWTNFEDGFDLVVTTDVPCHLWMRHTLEKPRIHAKGSTRRGLTLMKDVRFCFTQFIDNEQEEAGDTLTHTFIKRGWPFCVIWHYYFWGYVNGNVSNSTSPLFELHNDFIAPPFPPVPPENLMWFFNWISNPSSGRLYIALLNQAKNWATIYQTDNRGSLWAKVLDNADFGGGLNLPWMLVETGGGYLCLVFHKTTYPNYKAVWQAETLAGPWTKRLGTVDHNAIWRGFPYLHVAANTWDVWCSGVIGRSPYAKWVHRSANGGLTWCTAMTIGLEAIPSQIIVSPDYNHAILGGAGALATWQCRRSNNPTDCPGTWDTLGIACRSKYIGYASPYVVLPYNTYYCYSTDDGLNFVQRNIPLDMQTITSRHFSNGINLSELNPARILSAPVGLDGGVWVSYDFGVNWQKTLDQLGSAGDPYLNGVWWDKHEPDICYAWGRLGFFRSNDAGQTWTQRNNGFLDLP